jgi:hypothetical protein
LCTLTGGTWGGHSRSRSLSALHCAKDITMLISALVTFLVVILVLYLVNVNMLPVEGRIKQIIRIIVIVVGVLSLLRLLGVWI